MYGPELAAAYDAIHRSWKDYEAEAVLLTRHIWERKPDADSLLDVACGTGEHLAALRKEFDVTGVDVSAAMLDVARAKLPGIPLHQADMRTFDLGRRFDAVCCLFSSIGYLPDTAALAAAAERLVAHVEPGGVLLVEPWIFPDWWRDNTVSHDAVETRDGWVVRLLHTSSRGRTSVLDIHLLVGDAAGIRHHREVEELTLFTQDEYESAFARAGCPVTYFPGPPTNRGLYVGTRSR